MRMHTHVRARVHAFAQHKVLLQIYDNLLQYTLSNQIWGWWSLTHYLHRLKLFWIIHFFSNYLCILSLPSWTGIALQVKLLPYRLDIQGSIPTRGRDSSLCHHIHICSGTHTASCLLGNGFSFPEIKCPDHESNHLTPCNTKV